jgi:hypothetical protein
MRRNCLAASAALAFFRQFVWVGFLRVGYVESSCLDKGFTGLQEGLWKRLALGYAEICR